MPPDGTLSALPGVRTGAGGTRSSTSPAFPSSLSPFPLPPVRAPRLFPGSSGTSRGATGDPGGVRSSRASWSPGAPESFEAPGPAGAVESPEDRGCAVPVSAVSSARSPSATTASPRLPGPPWTGITTANIATAATSIPITMLTVGVLRLMASTLGAVMGDQAGMEMRRLSSSDDTDMYCQ